MPTLPSSKTQQALIKRALPVNQKYDPRKGQVALLQSLASNPTVKTVKCIFPTGYGKTDAIELSYKLLKEQGRVNALLIIVPSREQLSSYLSGIENDFKTKWGDEIIAYRFSSNFLKRVTLGVLNDECEVIIATCQTLTNPGNLEVAKQLLSTSGKRWMVALDELHRYSEYGQWGQSVGVLLEQKPEIVIGLTAAKDRTDGQPVAMDEPEVVIEVTHADAITEQAIRPFRTSVHDYLVSIEFNGDVYNITTKELGSLEGDYIEAKKSQGIAPSKAKAQAQEKIAYKDKYISPLVQNAVDCLHHKRQKLDKYGMPSAGHHRLLVFARDQKHAEHLKNYFNYGELSADWIGEKRADEINEQILRDFIGGELDVMINVNKASEGFNCVQCSVMLFLNNVGPSVTILQQLGRGLRRNYDIDWDQDVCDVFLSEDHPALSYFLDMKAMQPKEFNPDGIGIGSSNKPIIYDIPPIEFIDAQLHAVRIVDKVLNGANPDEFIQPVKDNIASKYGEVLAAQLSIEMVKEALVQMNLPMAEKQVMDVMGSTDRIEQAKKFNADAVRTLAANIVRTFSTGVFNKSRIGDVNKAINAFLKRRFNAGTDSMNESELKQRHVFIQEINKKLDQSPTDFAKEFRELCVC